ncbi:MAG TPA: protease pro-enzyme activation domain-containing protein [Candidatus Acidoferrales bacterium]|nr:protease pro-enzyme activation domain-containing protein [Candidatus Acidoferrales bacterium]
MLAGTALLLLPVLAAAQGSAVPARVTDRVDLNRLVTLAGNKHPLARAQYDQGAAPPDLPMNRMLLVLKRSPDQESALQNLLVQQQVKSSANYHKWMTPDQFGQQFGPADADIQAVTSWLASFGFQSIKVSKGRSVIEFSGTATQVEAGLHTSIHRYVVNGESHWANSSDPQIPAALAPVISGVVSMHDFRKKPASHLSSRKGSLTTSGGKPQITFTDMSHGLAPADFDTIYNVPSALTGSGFTIAVVARTNINPQDVADFRSQFGLPANFSASNIILDGPDPGNLLGQEEAEAVLDASWSGAIAPGATVDLVVSEATNATGGEDLSEFYIIDNNLADVMTESFDSCELNFLNAGIASAAAAFYGGLAEQAAAEGITYSVASGDGGPDACDDPSVAPVPANTLGPSVNILASTPFTVAVGGTEFHDCDTLPGCVDNSGTYWSSTNGANDISAKGYIPENVWNESCTTLGVNCTAIGLWSSGGGESDFFDGFFEQPPFQSGIPSSANGRLVPDVSFAAADHDGYVLCLDGSCQGTGCPTGVLVCYSVVSGTSVSAQAFGGVMALIAQKAGGRQGQADYVLYNLAATDTLSNCNASNAASPPASTCIFNDVTSGNTNIPGMNGFPATTGYDEATGLGSVNVGNLASKWSSAVIQGTTTQLRVCPNPPCVSLYGSPVNVTVIVTPVNSGQPTPTGDVSLVANLTGVQGAVGPRVGVDCNILPQTPLNQGGTGCNNVPNFNSTPVGTNGVQWSTTFLPGGTNYQLVAHYAGDGTFLGSDSAPVTVTVNPATSTTRLALVTIGDTTCTRQSSVTYGSQYVLEVSVVDSAALMGGNGGTVCAPTPSGALPTGKVTVTDSLNGGAATSLDGGTFNLNSFGYFEDQNAPSSLAVGTHSIQASYQGDNSFNRSTTNAPSVTVTKAPTIASVTAPASVTANTPFSVTVIVDTLTSTNPPVGSLGAAPSGMVTFSATVAAATFPTQRRGPGPNPFIFGEMCAGIASTLLLLMAAKRCRGAVWLATAVILVIAVGTSCGSSSGSNPTKTITLGTANLVPAPKGDLNGFAAATATLSNAMLSTGGTITATYSGDGNYNGSTSPGVSITVH